MNPTAEDRARETFAEECERAGEPSAAALVRQHGEGDGGGFAIILAAMESYASEREAQAIERCAKLVENAGTDQIPLPGNPRQMHGTYAQGAFAAMKAIATAIRSTKDPT